MRRLIRYLLTAAILMQTFTRWASAQDLEQISSATPFSVHGGLSARMVHYHADGIPVRRKPFSYIINGNLNASLFEAIQIPVTFTYSNQNFFLGQPFNQFGVSPGFKWATVHLGYRNLNYSSYTLAAHQIRGAGFELSPGKFRLGFMAGRFQRAVQPDTTLVSLRAPMYRRTGWSARIGYGNATDFIDVIVLKAKDDSTSIEAVNQISSPAENLVIGLNGRKRFLKYLSAFFDGAVSTYVERLGAVGSGSNIKTFGLIRANASARVHRAFKTGLSFRRRKISLSGYLQRIDPGYRSMGIYFVNNDLETINVNAATAVFKSKLNVSGGMTFQRDNLDGAKPFTTRRRLPQLTLAYVPNSRWNIGGTYTSMSMLQEQGVLPLDNELKMDQSNAVYSLFSTYTVADTLRSHSVSVFLNRSELIDNNPFTQAFSQYVGNTTNISYHYMHVKSNWSFSLGLNANNIKTYNGSLPGTGFSLGAGKAFNNGVTWNVSASTAFQSGVNSWSVTNGLLRQVGKVGLNLNINYLKTVLADGSYDELHAFLTASYRF